MASGTERNNAKPVFFGVAQMVMVVLGSPSTAIASAFRNVRHSAVSNGKTYGAFSQNLIGIFEPSLFSPFANMLATHILASVFFPTLLDLFAVQILTVLISFPKPGLTLPGSFTTSIALTVLAYLFFSALRESIAIDSSSQSRFNIRLSSLFSKTAFALSAKAILCVGLFEKLIDRLFCLTLRTSLERSQRSALSLEVSNG